MTDDTDNIVNLPKHPYVWTPFFPSIELDLQLRANYGDFDARMMLKMLEAMQPQIDAYVAAWENDVFYGSGTGGMHLLETEDA